MRLSGARLSITKAILPLVEVELDPPPLVLTDLTVMMAEIQSEIDFTYGKHFFKPVFYWIPRDIWPTEPDSFSRYYAENLNLNLYAGGGSEPMTFVGELYWNFSLLGVVLALELGMLIWRIDDYSLGAIDLLLYVNSIILATMMFYVFRGPMDTFWLAFAFYFLGWFMVSTIAELFDNASRAAEVRHSR